MPSLNVVVLRDSRGVRNSLGLPVYQKTFPAERERESDRPWYFVQRSISGRRRLKLSRVRLSHHHFLILSEPSTCLGIDQRLFFIFFIFFLFFDRR